jgi:hypothetical protein
MATNVLKIAIITMGGYRVAIPLCRNSASACRLVGRPYLTATDLKLLELLGHTISIERKIDVATEPEC